MNYTEVPITFSCAGETLVGIVARPESPSRVGVVMPVGGPQYRAGSHRQFTLLARRLAAAGHAVLRFDYRGMGDSTGAQTHFESVAPDIGAAVDALTRQVPNVQGVVLWGLCDAASSALIYWDETRDPRIDGLCLLNPWARSEATLARTQVKHYYVQRLLSKELWLKLLSGRLNILSSLGELAGKLRQATAKHTPADAAGPANYQTRMASAWRAFPGPIHLILSGDDYTAKEFLEYAAAHGEWQGLLARPAVTRTVLADADHTFSTARWRDQVESACLDWLAPFASSIGTMPPGPRSSLVQSMPAPTAAKTPS